MKLRHLFFTAGICAATVLTLAGCGSSSSGSAADKSDIKVATTGFPIVKKPLTMSIMAPSMGLANWSDMPTLQDYAKKTNIKLKYNTPPSADFGTKLNLAFASQDLPDIIFAAGSSNLTAANEVTYGKNGQLVALEKLIPKYAPNLDKLMKKNPAIRKSITTPDGHIYALPYLAEDTIASWYIGPMWYNGEWLKKLGVKTLPKTTDEFYDLLKRFKNEDPNGNGKADEIPLTDVKMNNARVWLMAAFGLLSQDVQNNNGKVIYTPISSNYKAYLTFMHKLFAEGLLDKDTFSQSDDQKKAKGQADRLGAFCDYFSYFTTGRSTAQAVNDPMFQPLTSPQSKKTVVPLSPKINRGNFAITKNNPSPAAALRWVDYLYSDKGAIYFNQGPEGYVWQSAKNSKGQDVRVFAKGVNPDNVEDKRGKITPAYGLTVPMLSADRDQYALRKDPDAPAVDNFTKFVRKETKDKIDPNGRIPYPLVYLTKDEQDSVASSANDLKTFVEESEAKFITGVKPLSEWDSYVKTIKGMNVDQYVKVYQAAYDRWKKAD
ncbi:extracellular solute-binding protein [Schleiferilactobacillus harbinensis]|jgi:putative aldouronate transport system substrate-binding protein|uniref:Extracellular solute-binding protein n=1 Tax=Schleiferilactobacillus harbinensis TaxID=304207 RepID=A0A510TW26_9LACO|nr:extracellular solute-binding protein [Schleiferilactobacillus harbinensis]MBO3091609.1 extracellular solute-binding protein [Schleiferilactobacillus harbinensis]MCI1686802.1 extracellular solute-binding protein [Schleiferilactobacillus harbinensis]MCI1782677.1 extracellular solute-binding protein [Schleiferilactobacillus harbinensis]MCI1849621.1 extracellular solute-binding protein [Schleiferilactobacillus harbinensis]QEU48375.1 extracellular solute-binding protein [Schleiferilactobacillus 